MVSLSVEFSVVAALDLLFRTYSLGIDRSNACQQEVGGGLFVSSTSGSEVIAAYYHPTKKHSATANGGLFGGGQVRSIASAGNWAVARSSSGMLGRKTFWNNDIQE